MPETAVTEVPVTSTPAPSSSTSGTPASAPATSAIATTPTTPPASERPTDVKSLSAFMQKLDTTADATTPTAPLVADPAAAAIPPPTTGQPAGVSEPASAKGPIPFDVHHTALANARTHAVAEYKKQHGWAEQFKPEQRDWLIDAATRMKDPVAFHRWFGEQLNAHPQYRQQLAAPPAAQPDVEIQDAQGNVIGKLSQFLQAEREQIRGEFTNLVKPILTERDQRLQKEKEDAAHQDLEKRTDGVMAQVNRVLRLDKLPQDEQAAIGKKLLDEMVRTPDALDAALIVFERDVVPSLERKGQQAAADTNLKKAAGNTANGTSAGTKPSIGPNSSQKEIAAYLRTLEG